MSDLISRQEAINTMMALQAEDDEAYGCHIPEGFDGERAKEALEHLPSAQPEPHYCRECKWSRCHIYSDVHGKSETYWRCLNWDGETDEEGYCHEWKRRTDDLE